MSTPLKTKSNIITSLEDKFIELYIIDGNATQAVVKAGYKTKSPSRYINIKIKGRISGKMKEKRVSI